MKKLVRPFLLFAVPALSAPASAQCASDHTARTPIGDLEFIANTMPAGTP